MSCLKIKNSWRVYHQGYVLMLSLCGKDDKWAKSYWGKNNYVEKFFLNNRDIKNLVDFMHFKVFIYYLG